MELFPISPGPFIGPVEIRGKKNKKKYISFLPPVYTGGRKEIYFFLFFSPRISTGPIKGPGDITYKITYHL